MFPVLFEIPILGGVRIYTYGLLVALAFLAGIGWSTREGRLAGFPKEKILDLSFYLILGALIGSRILYIFVEWRRYLQNPLDILKIWEGGLVFYGGFVGAVLSAILYGRRYQISFLKLSDIFSPGIALGHAIGRLGCFAAGCCHGAPTSGPLSIIYPDLPFSLAPAGIALYPTQLMESGSVFLIFLTLLLIRRKPHFQGQVFITYLILYGLARFLLEYFRGSLARTFLIDPWLSVSQMIALVLVLIAWGLYVKKRKRKA
ncbi:MAG: prolipoprotein diacylglyceryl transferase [Deltaproteobacteria bacterium]|nr:prolipoprotein diacylglyceryl transferase [Deltaproteobacteria bacterium]